MAVSVASERLEVVKGGASPQGTNLYHMAIANANSGKSGKSDRNLDRTKNRQSLRACYRTSAHYADVRCPTLHVPPARGPGEQLPLFKTYDTFGYTRNSRILEFRSITWDSVPNNEF